MQKRSSASRLSALGAMAATVMLLVSLMGVGSASAAPTPVAVENLRAQLAGNDVTLTWDFHDMIPQGHVWDIYDNGAPETRVLRWVAGSRGSVSVTLPRMQSGRVHRFTVELQFSPEVGRETVTVTIPGTGDTTPPSPPTNLFSDFILRPDGTPLLRVHWDPATDDTTPRDDIAYEHWVLKDPSSNPPSDLRIVHEYSVSSGTSFVQGLQGPWIVAVDASGNRSQMALIPGLR